MVERLEADLGVKVQEVRFPELRSSFEIWDNYMGLPDKEGKVGPPDNLIQSSGSIIGADKWVFHQISF